MTATSIEPRRTLRPLPYPLAAYYDAYGTLAEEPEFDQRGRVLRLPMITVATLRYTSPDVNALALRTRGRATEASILLAAWAHRGHMTAWEIAEEFQERYFGARSRGFTRGLDYYRRIPRKGFDLIAATDALGYVQWSCDIEDADDWRKFQTVRLSEAMTQAH